MLVCRGPAYAGCAGQFWAAALAEARKRELTLVEVVAKHSLSVAALKYHMCKGERGGGRKRTIRLRACYRSGQEQERAGTTIEAELGLVRIRFREGCNAAYVAALLGALANC